MLAGLYRLQPVVLEALAPKMSILEFHCIVVSPITVLVARKSEDKLTNFSVWALA
jgi:hypothetical protein